MEKGETDGSAKKRLFWDKQNLTSLDGIEKYSRVLTKFSAADNNITSLKPLIHCVQLKKLFVSYNKNLKSLRGMESLTNLTHLCFDNCRIESLKPLVNCTKLLHVDAHSNDIKSLDGMINCSD